MPLPSIDPSRYAEQLELKLERFKGAFADLNIPEPVVARSHSLHYRLRAEFRIWHEGDRIDYVMFDPADPKRPIIIDQFDAATASIHAAMPRLREHIAQDEVLKNKLFQVDFLATLSGELMITLVYHRQLDEHWAQAARVLAGTLNAQVIGRSRKQKVVLDQDWLLEAFELDGRCLRYQQIEGSFTQPNGEVNRQMLRWARQCATGLGGDLLELYCGNGNFTIALAPLFRQVLATEVSQSSVAAARYNLAANEVSNVTLVRMSSEDLSGAMAGLRPYRRMRDVDLASYAFSTIFVDPPRSGLDSATLALARGFQHILYISCNPTSLHDNIVALQGTHVVRAAAIFDQFPYTQHLECGLLLSRAS